MNEPIGFQTKKRRFNVIDLLLLVILAMLAAAITIRAVTGSNEKKRSLPPLKATEISFLVKGIDVGVADHVVLKDSLTADGGERFGSVKSFDLHPAELISENGEGKPVTVYSDSAYDIRGVISAEGITDDTGFLLNGTLPLAPGQTVTVNGTDVTFTLLITDIAVLG